MSIQNTVGGSLHRTTSILRYPTVTRDAVWVSLFLVLVSTFVPAVVSAQSDTEETAIENPGPVEINLVADASPAEVAEAQSRNDEYLKREILYFAKRHQFVRMNDTELMKAERVAIQFFDDVLVVAERREFQRTPGLDIWEGVIVDPIRPTELLEYPSGKPIDEETTREILDRQNSITIYAHLLPSIVTGPSTNSRAIQVGVQVAAFDDATFVIESLKDGSLIHIAYELDRDKCCFASLDTPIDSNSPSGARALEKGRAYWQYLRELDAAVNSPVNETVPK